MRKIGDVNQIEILVVGGGTAGWLTANLLNSLLNQKGQERFLVSLVESKSISKIGVGEATLPTLRQTLSDIGLSEEIFLTRTNATFKHAIRFNKWSKDPVSSPNDGYYHSFEVFDHMQRSGPVDYLASAGDFANNQNIDISTLWWHAARSGATDEYAYYAGVQAYLCDAGKAPKRIGEKEFMGNVNYAYHTDAVLFASLLTEHGKRNLINHIIDDVIGVDLSPEGYIEKVRCKERGSIEADFFVDCTGFASTLMGDALGVPFISYSDHLLCDRAIALQLPKSKPPRPFTTSTATDFGWIWEIDLTSRTGTGHIYSSNHCSDTVAEQTLLDHHGVKRGDVSLRTLEMRVGRTSQFWKGNCVAVGLSAGFLEPLESTGIYLIEYGARLLADLFQEGRPTEDAISLYNDSMTQQFESIRDFIVLHYCTSQRKDTPFWKEVIKAERIPATLQSKMNLWKYYLPTSQHFGGYANLFDAANYKAVLFGMGWEISNPSGRHTLRTPVDYEEGIKCIWQAAEKALAELPGHDELLADIGIRADARSDLLKIEKLDLRAGIRVAGLAKEASRIQISAGSQLATEIDADSGRYHLDAVIPAPVWRPPNREELGLLIPDDSVKGLSDFLAIFKLPVEIYQRLRSIVFDSVKLGGTGERVLTTEANRAETERCVLEVIDQFKEPGSYYRSLGLLVNSSGHLTITGDKFDLKRIGLHVDSWAMLPVDLRQKAPNRICINLGDQARQILFVNLTLTSIVQILAARNIPLAGLGATDLGRLFLRKFPSYPVIAIQVNPGEAYIAPTENLIHDGSSELMTSEDVTFTAIGHFANSFC